MFKATIESISHEGGLMAPFSGSSPALGSVIVNSADGMYIGKIDAVLGNLQSPIAHIAHLDRKIDPNTLLESFLLPQRLHSVLKPKLELLHLLQIQSLLLRSLELFLSLLSRRSLE